MNETTNETGTPWPQPASAPADQRHHEAPREARIDRRGDGTGWTPSVTRASQPPATFVKWSVPERRPDTVPQGRRQPSREITRKIAEIEATAAGQAVGPDPYTPPGSPGTGTSGPEVVR